MKKAMVLGGGLVGAVLAEDLLEDGGLEVTLADVSEDRLAAVAARSGGALRTQVLDCSDPAAIESAVGGADVVLGALPSRLGFGALEAVCRAGVPYCDISFMTEDARRLDALARERGVTAVVDCGVAPGMSNMLARHAAARLDRAESVRIYVGGLPRERRWPFEYKAGFAPSDVIEEYTRPCTVVEGGRRVEREALSEVERVDLPGVGTLEAFLTDGLRSLVDTLEVPELKEKTMRYPGHCELMRVFRETGLFSSEPISAGGVSVAPRDVTSALLFPRWTFQEGEEDVTLMRVEARGERAGRAAVVGWELEDRYDPERGRTSMSRTTAFPCAIVARLLLEGRVAGPGVLPPEAVAAQPGLLDTVLSGLERRGVRYREA